MELTHLDSTGAARMVDISQKDTTERVAVATSKLRMKAETLQVVLSGNSKKGDIQAAARIAGIMAAKRTSELIPLCHPLFLTHAAVQFEAHNEWELLITATVKTTGKTGVEMEALVAASIAALTIYDMVKAMDREMVIEETCLALKDGGKSGRFERPIIG